MLLMILYKIVFPVAVFVYTVVVVGKEDYE